MYSGFVWGMKSDPDIEVVDPSTLSTLCVKGFLDHDPSEGHGADILAVMEEDEAEGGDARISWKRVRFNTPRPTEASHAPVLAAVLSVGQQGPSPSSHGKLISARWNRSEAPE